MSILLVATLCCSVASASNTRARCYLSSDDAFLHAGDSSGELTLDFSVALTRACTSYGISKVRLYTEDGDFIETVTTTNGPLTSGRFYLHEYDFSATPEERYYAIVTIYAADADGSNYRVYATDVAMVKHEIDALCLYAQVNHPRA